LAGNIGAPALDLLDAEPGVAVVLELSKIPLSHSQESGAIKLGIAPHIIVGPWSECLPFFVDPFFFDHVAGGEKHIC